MRFIKTSSIYQHLKPEFHPGMWFRDVFDALNDDERTAWVTLFTLAWVSYPVGQINFVSESQLSDFFNIDREGFISAVKKAQQLSKVKLVEKAVVPCSINRERIASGSQIEAGQTIFRIVPSSPPWARYKTMEFPGFYDFLNLPKYKNDRVNQFSKEREASALKFGQMVTKAIEKVTDSPLQKEEEERSTEAEESAGKYEIHPLAEELHGPAFYLGRLMDKAQDHKIVFSKSVESPFCCLTLEDLPEAVYFYDEAFGKLDLETLESLDSGLAFWNDNHEQLLGSIYSDWKSIEYWFFELREELFRQAQQENGAAPFISQGDSALPAEAKPLCPISNEKRGIN